MQLNYFWKLVLQVKVILLKNTILALYHYSSPQILKCILCIQFFSTRSKDLKSVPQLNPSSIASMDNPYQNPAAAAAILAMHQAPASNGSHNPQRYNYLHAQEQLHPSSITHASNQYGALHPSLPHLPTAQDYVTAAARRLNEHIYASRNAVDDSMKGKYSSNINYVISLT